MTLEHDSLLPPGVRISYESQCGDSEKRLGEAADRGQCNHVRINQTVRRKGVGCGVGVGGIEQAGGDGGTGLGNNVKSLRYPPPVLSETL